MPFQLQKTKVDLQDTPIENLFLDVYMPTAPGDYVKVYLLGFRYALESTEGKRFTTHTLAINLGLSPQQVMEAWEYWQSKGLLQLNPTNDPENPVIEFLSLKTLHLRHTPDQPATTETGEETPPTYTATPADLVEAHDREEFRQFFKAIDRLLQRPLVPNEELQILEWIHHYKVDRDVVLLAFQYAVQQKEVRSVNYVSGIVRNWSDQDLTTTSSVKQFLDSKQLHYKHYDAIFKALGFHGRLPTEAEARFMDKWLDQYTFSMDMILKACELTAGTTKPSIKYINGILERWHKEGLATPEAVDEQESLRKEKPSARDKSRSSQTTKKTGFHLPESRGKDYTNDELEKILLGRKRRPRKGDGK